MNFRSANFNDSRVEMSLAVALSVWFVANTTVILVYQFGWPWIKVAGLFGKVAVWAFMPPVAILLTLAQWANLIHWW